VDEQQMHGQPVEVSSYLYLIEIAKVTLENENLSSSAGPASCRAGRLSQSKEGDDRREAKLDNILRKIDPDNYRIS
jgi:hypothetical protein